MRTLRSDQGREISSRSLISGLPWDEVGFHLTLKLTPTLTLKFTLTLTPTPTLGVTLTLVLATPHFL